jgi:hypothetical protein
MKLYAVAQLVEALRYEPGGLGLDSRWWLFKFFIDSVLPVAIWPWCVGLTTLSPSYPEFIEILGASYSWSSKGFSRSVMGVVFLITKRSLVYATSIIIIS